MRRGLEALGSVFGAGLLHCYCVTQALRWLYMSMQPDARGWKAGNKS